MSKGVIKKKADKRPQPTVKDPERVCVLCGKDYIAVAPLQKTCSKECRKSKDKKALKEWNLRNPDKMKEYNKNRLAKDPDVWKKKYHKDRAEIFDALGNKCIVCGHDNPLHFHVDYIPTMIGSGYRHPRHKKWILDHIEDFRILCANHHYELTCTGEIQGTDIKQKRYEPKK